MTHERSVSLLKFAAILLEVFGLVTVLCLIPALSGILDLFLKLALLDGGAAAPFASAEARLLTAVCGGVSFGFGAAIWMITTRVYATDPETGGPLLIVPAVAWFVVDGLGSMLAGAAFNVVLNAAILALILVPVLAARQGRAPA